MNWYNRENDDFMQHTRPLMKRNYPGGILVIKGDIPGMSVPMQDGEMLTIGRSTECCNIILTDGQISRKHCTIAYHAGERCYYVTDHSSMGTFILGGYRLRKGREERCYPQTQLRLANEKNILMLK